MIGTFLVTVAAVCAVFRCWWDRLEYYLYKTEIGHSIWVAHTEPQGGPRRQSLFVQYFLRGREFWWWTPTDGVGGWDRDADVVELLLLNQSLPKRRGKKVQSAFLVTGSDEIDVTEFLQQLSGPQGDFYQAFDQGRPVLDADTVRAYLGLRLPAQHLPTEKPETEWLYMGMENEAALCKKRLYWSCNTMNALDNLSIYDLPEQMEAEYILKQIKTWDCKAELKRFWRFDVKHPGNVRRLLKAGYKVYRPQGEGTSKDLFITLPDYDITTASGRFAPVLLENNKLIGF